MIRFAPSESATGKWHWRGRQPAVYDEVAALQAVGVDLVLNLRSDLVGSEANDREAAWCRSLGLAHVHIPMSPITPPTRGEVVQALAEFGGRSVYVHCLDGVDRTGVVVGAYRTAVQGWTSEAAIGEMIAEGFHTIRYFWWMAAIRKRLAGF